MNFAELESQLPDQSVVWNGFGAPVQINANVVTGDALTIESSPVEFTVKLLTALFKLQTQINLERVAAGKPLVNLIDREMVLTSDEKLKTVYSVTIESSLAAALDSVIDPTAEEE